MKILIRTCFDDNKVGTYADGSAEVEGILNGSYWYLSEADAIIVSTQCSYQALI